MEAEGAEVVSFDVGFDRSVDLLPRPGVNPEWARMDAMTHICMVQNSWWYLGRHFDSSAKMVYGNIYQLPGDLGTFDISVLAAILLHLRSPFDALQQAADRTSDQIIVTEPLQDPALNSDEKLMRFAPFGTENPGNWWLFTPATIVDMVRHVGFPQTSVTFHGQLHHLGHDLGKPAQDLAMFTVVGSRT
jgi:O-methyltransferase